MPPTKDEAGSDDASDASSCYADMGFMFEGSEPTRTLSLDYGCGRVSCCCRDSPKQLPSEDFGDGEGTVAARPAAGPFPVRVEITAVDGDPGAVQSGHYLWPAAPALAGLLVESLCPAPPSAGSGEGPECECDDASCRECLPCRLCRILAGLPTKRPVVVAELGAGCGLVGLAALQALVRRGDVGCAAFTDHDPGTLDRCRENLESTLRRIEALGERSEVGKVSDIPVLFELLSWGDEKGASELRNAAQVHSCEGGSTFAGDVGFDIILGSDLIYCRDVVRPLFQTAAWLMRPNVALDDGVKSQAIPLFIMTQSFSYEEDTEKEMGNVCVELGFKQTVLSDELGKEGGVKVQTFSFQN